MRAIRLSRHEAKEAIHALTYEVSSGSVNAQELLDKFLTVWPELEDWADDLLVELAEEGF